MTFSGLDMTASVAGIRRWLEAMKEQMADVRFVWRDGSHADPMYRIGNHFIAIENLLKQIEARPADGPPPEDLAKLLLDYLCDMVSGEDVVFRRTRTPDEYAAELCEAHEIEVRLYRGDDHETAELALLRDALEHGTPAFVAKVKTAQAELRAPGPGAHPPTTEGQ